MGVSRQATAIAVLGPAGYNGAGTKRRVLTDLTHIVYQVGWDEGYSVLIDDDFQATKYLL